MEVKAKLRYTRMAPRKIRLVADVVRGKNVNEAIKALAFLNKKAAPIVKKLIRSAIANAEQKKTVDVDNLFIKLITVDQGPTMKRFMPRAQGRASEIRKKTSHINLILAEK